MSSSYGRPVFSRHLIFEKLDDSFVGSIFFALAGSPSDFPDENKKSSKHVIIRKPSWNRIVRVCESQLLARISWMPAHHVKTSSTQKLSLASLSILIDPYIGNQASDFALMKGALCFFRRRPTTVRVKQNRCYPLGPVD